MKKIIIAIMVCLVSSMAFALTLSGESPSDGSTLSGDVSSIDFSVQDLDNSATGGTLYVDGVGSYPLVCAGAPTTCSANLDLSAWAEQNYDYYFFVTDGVIPAYYPSDAATGGRFTTTLDKVPLPPSFLSVFGVDETTLGLSWTASTSGDIDHYNIYRDDAGYILIDTSAGTTYNDLGLTTGNTYCYQITAVDILGQESVVNGPECELVKDSTPPVIPVLNPVSGSTVGTTNPAITIDYSAEGEDITLKIYSGTTLVKDMGAGQVYNWNPILNANTTYLFTLVAEDKFGNQRNTTYSITTTAMADLDVSILDTVHITSYGEQVIDSALPGGYLLIKYSVSMYGGDFVRLQMTDLVSIADTIDVDSESAPIAFCGEDYDSATQDIVGAPVRNVYNVLNTYDETPGNALNCADTDVSGEVQYDVYLKIPLPIDAKSGQYASTVNIGMYDTI